MNPSWQNPCSREGGMRLDFGHLGGTSTAGDLDSWFPELWDWLVRDFNVESMLDLGCGVGFTQRWFQERGVHAEGLDCRQVLDHHVLRSTHPSWLQAHDLTTGPLRFRSYPHSTRKPFDLVWCCDVGEHLGGEFVDNLVRTVVDNVEKVVAFCAAPPGSGGHHHVNCQPGEWWVEKFISAGLTFLPVLTEHARYLCPGDAYGRSPHNYFRRSGLVFTR